MRPVTETAVCALLDWDTEFWGVPIGRVEGATLDTARLAAVDEWAAANEIACLYFLADSADAPSAHAAEAGGFRLMDLRVELRRACSGDESISGLREARPDDAEALLALARASHGVTRFYADSNFPDERCDDLYEMWIARSLEGWADCVLVAEAEGRPVGYVSCHIDAETKTGSMGLLAVDPDVRRAGVGVALSRGAVAWCREHGAEQMSVVTQGRNVGAMRTFQRVGYLVDSVALWFHKWYEV